MRARTTDGKARHAPERRAEVPSRPGPTGTILALSAAPGTGPSRGSVTQPPPMPLTTDPLAGTTTGDLAPPDPRPPCCVSGVQSGDQDASIAAVPPAL